VSFYPFYPLTSVVHFDQLIVNAAV